MQVDGVEHEPGLRRVRADRHDVRRGDVVARQDDDVELGAALGEEVGDRGDVRVEQHLDAEPLQVGT